LQRICRAYHATRFLPTVAGNHAELTKQTSDSCRCRQTGSDHHAEPVSPKRPFLFCAVHKWLNIPIYTGMIFPAGMPCTDQSRSKNNNHALKPSETVRNYAKGMQQLFLKKTHENT
jgi:hypothetical protein